MLNNALTTNEVKDHSGTEVEFQRLSTSNRSTVFAKVGETPALPHRLSIEHQEIGSGLKARRRSKVRFDITVASAIDPTLTVTTSAYIVVDAPVGALSTDVSIRDAVAELLSFTATTGSATTVLFDCSGNGASALVAGSL